MDPTPAEMTEYFLRQGKERRAAALNARIPERLKASLELLADYWTKRESVALGDADAEVSLGDVVVRLLSLGVEGAWAEAGLAPYPDKATVEKLKQRLDKSNA